VNFFCERIYAGNRFRYQTHSGRWTESNEIDSHVIAAILTRDETGNHRRIRYRWRVVHQGDGNPGKRQHSPAANEQQMGIPGSNQDDTPLNGMGAFWPLHGLLLVDGE
jgi:hypothetical protein